MPPFTADQETRTDPLHHQSRSSSQGWFAVVLDEGPNGKPEKRDGAFGGILNEKLRFGSAGSEGDGAGG